MAKATRVRAYFSPGEGVVYETELELPHPYPWPIDEVGRVATDMVDRMIERVAELHSVEDDDGQGAAPDA